MARDNKYGEVVLEHGDVGEDELVVVFRARDFHLPEVLHAYYILCMNNNSPQRHLDLIMDSHKKIVAWQKENIEEVHIPTSENSKKWME